MVSGWAKYRLTTLMSLTVLVACRPSEVAKRKLRRDGSHVLLLHLNQLNADHIGAALDSLAADGAEFVPLDTVLGDALYSLPDLYVGGRGWSWLYRIAPFDPADAVWDDAEAARVDTLLRQGMGSR